MDERMKKRRKKEKSRVYSEENSKFDIAEDSSNFSYRSEKKNDEENTQLEIIEEETKNYIDEMKKGTYNILVIK